jgi:asparagine synthase (glutamine-hydrolysing)
MGGSGHHVFAVKNNIFANRNRINRHLNRVLSWLASLGVDNPTPSIISKIQRKFYRGALSPVHAAYDLRSGFPDIVKRYLCVPDIWDIHLKTDPYRHPETWFQEAEGLDDINRYLYADIKFYVPDDLMIKVDRMSMAHGLETLSPFQDIKLAEIVNKLPGT